MAAGKINNCGWWLAGEIGWKLSQGERSRLYIAGALPQGIQLVVLDESFASLDRENLRRFALVARLGKDIGSVIRFQPSEGEVRPSVLNVPFNIKSIRLALL